MGYIKRSIEAYLTEIMKEFPSVIVTGARQVGKTTLLRELFPNYSYVSLDRPSRAELAETDPEAFLARFAPPLIIDEIQYVPKLLRTIKAEIDENRELKGRFILTGSQKFKLMEGVSESLAGRTALIELEGLSLAELSTHEKIAKDSTDYSQVFLRGFFPELWKEDYSRKAIDLFFDSFVATFLERDIRQILSVGSLRDFERFLRACALRSGQILNRAELARDLGISASTAGDWLSGLECSGLITLLEPWHSNMSKRIFKSPKLYFADPGLMLNLIGIDPLLAADSNYIGAVWETLVFAELRKMFALNQRTKLWYYRDQNQKEIDFVVEQGLKLDLIECKWTLNPSISHAKALIEGQKAVNSQNKSTHKINSLQLISRSPISWANQAQNLKFSSPFDLKTSIPRALKD